MPSRIITVPVRWWRYIVTEHPNVVLTALVFMLVIALGFAVAGWNAARSAEHRVSRIEAERLAERAAQEEGEKISKVVTCLNAAKTRPVLATVLRALAGRETDAATRAAYGILIDRYEQQATPGISGAPTRPKCLALAFRLGIDPAPYERPGER